MLVLSPFLPHSGGGHQGGGAHGRAGRPHKPLLRAGYTGKVRGRGGVREETPGGCRPGGRVWRGLQQGRHFQFARMALECDPSRSLDGE